MIQMTKWILTGLALCLVSQIAYAGKYITVDDQSHAITTPITISALADIDKTSHHTGFVISGLFNSHATHKRHLFVLAGKINFAGVLEDDAIFAGGEIVVDSQAQANKDLRLIGGSVRLEGNVNGNLTVMAGEVVIDGKVGGDVELVAKSIQFGPAADVSGRIQYTSQAMPVIDAQASLNHQPKAVAQVAIGLTVDKANQIKRNYALFFTASFGLLAAVWAWFFPTVIREHHQLISQAPGKCLTVGFATFFLLPLLGVVAMGTVIGVTLGMLLIIIYILLNSLGFASMGFSVGAGLVKICQRPAILDDRRWLPLVAAFGITCLVLLAFFVKYGFIIDIAAFLFGLGALVQLLWRGYNSQDKLVAT